MEGKQLNADSVQMDEQIWFLVLEIQGLNIYEPEHPAWYNDRLIKAPDQRVCGN